MACYPHKGGKAGADMNGGVRVFDIRIVEEDVGASCILNVSDAIRSGSKVCARTRVLRGESMETYALPADLKAPFAPKSTTSSTTYLLFDGPLSLDKSR